MPGVGWGIVSGSGSASAGGTGGTYAWTMRRAVLGSLTAVSLVVLAGCAGGSAPASSSPAAAGGNGTCEYIVSGDAAREVQTPAADPAVSGEVAATIQTSAGAIPMTLNADAAPCTVGSFVSLAEQGYFAETSCHRLTTSGIFVLQCGDPTGTGRGGPGYKYADELTGTETYPAGTVAMANAGPDTNGSQFFLVYEDTQLPPSYTVFGQMDLVGLTVVQQIAAVGVENGATDGAPGTPVTITGVLLD
jgi:peptidyl-prolyl cis-trans isomerase B (cyclophilin B)